MRRLFTRRLVPALATLVFLAALPVRAQDAVPAVPDQGLQALQVLYWHIEEAIRDNDRDKLREVFSPLLPDQQGQVLVDDLLSTRNSRAVVRERDRIVLPDAPLGTGFRLVTEVFVESGDSGRIVTYRLDVYRSNPSEATWAIGAVEALNRIDGLYRLVLDDSRHVAVRDLRVTAEDFQLALPSGVVFVARIGEGVSAMVLVGDGTMTFSPRPPAERVQVKLFAGSETLTAPFTMAYLRLNPFDLTTIVNREAFAEEGPADPKIAARATEFFAAQLPRSFSLDLNDLSRETWSLVPGSGDLIADVRTRKYDVLTYARSNNEAEDISVFDRASRRNIAVYPSAARMAARGRTYNEDNLVDYDVANYFVDATYQPERSWLQGRTQLQVRVRAFALSTLTLRLAEPLVVRSVVSDRHGRLLAIRVRDQNNVLVTFPKPVYRDDVLVLSVSYGGRIEAQPPDREVAGVSAEQVFPSSDMPQVPPEPRWILSNRSYWYPQNTVTDYATGVLRLSVPASYDVAASGDAGPSNPSLTPGTSPTDPGRKTYLFHVPQPTRYFSWLITRLVPAGTMTVLLPDATRGTNQAPDGTPGSNGAMQTQAVPPVFPPGVRYLGMEVMALANPRQTGRARNMLPQAGEILAFYGSLVDDFPYPSFTLAVLDDDLPGGHSPAYLGLVHQPLPTTPFAWRNDPVYFDEYPRFFLAHEIAHQYWGHAVGWKSYHEQWISEGFAQFFALLYAERAGGRGVARSVLSRLRSTAMAQSAQGPIELGYRLGHIKRDSRVYRSLIYNKAALVLHMLRQLIGDEAFFAGLRKFYWESRFMKVGTDEVREAFEATSGRQLGRFFDRWIREFAIPTVRYSTTVQGDTLVATFEQDANAVHDLPVTVTIRYASGERQDVVVPLAEASTTARLPLKGPVRGVDVNEDNASLARFERR